MGLRVLVADDSAMTRTLVSEAVRAGPVPIAEVIAVCDGEEAFATLKAREVDLLLTDIRMPHVDGLELLARIAHTPSLAGVHVVTLSSDEGTQLSARAAGRRVHAHLLKPIRFDSINEILVEIWRAVSDAAK
jgi:CheY-like chemotaxis protein